MKTLISALVALGVSGSLSAEILENGFYRMADGEPAPRIKSQDGGKVFLGSPESLSIERSWILSSNNENSAFQLCIEMPYQEDSSPPIYLLAVDGIAYRQTGSSSSKGETSCLHFALSGMENAKKVSKHLNAPIKYRVHPGYQLCISFSTENREYLPGEEVNAILRITNVGPNEICFQQGGRNRGSRDNQYIFAARLFGKQLDDIGTSQHFGGLSRRITLKPTEKFEDIVSLNDWFAFQEAGLYEIHGSYFLNLMDPGKDSYRSIWTDYLSNDFSVRIKNREDSE